MGLIVVVRLSVGWRTVVVVVAARAIVVVSVDPLGDGGLEVVAVLPGSGPDQLALVGLAQGLGRGVVVGRAHPASGGVGPLRQEPVGVGDGQILRPRVASGVRGL